MALHWVWLVLLPALVVCAGAKATETVSAPGTVSDLAVTATSTTSVALRFTEVDDGDGRPAGYEIRYAVTPISWASAGHVATGTCSTPVAGTRVGSALACTVVGLAASTKYDFQVIAFREPFGADTKFGSVSNVASATTAQSPPPPPTGTLLFQENFEDANLASRGWYDNTGVLLSTTEHIGGSNSSAQYRYLVGAEVPTSGGPQRHKFTPSTSFYLSYHVKYSANWVGSSRSYHPHEFNVLSTMDGDYDGPSQNYLTLYIEQNYQSGGMPRLAMQDNKSVNYDYGPLPNNIAGVTESRSTSGCNGVVESNIYSECFNAGSYWYNLKHLTGPVVFQPDPGPGYKNDWNFVEAYFQLNTIVNGVGQADGVMQYWFNGTLVIDRHDILFRTGAQPTLQFAQFLIAPYIGDGSPADQSMFIDNLKVATARIP